MAVTHTTTVRNGLADYVVDLVDAGTGDASGDLVILTSGDSPVATLTFANPAFGAASGGTATANAIASDTNAAGGTAAKFTVRDRDNTTIFSGSVTTVGGGGDIELSSVVIGPGDTLAISSFTYTASL